MTDLKKLFKDAETAGILNRGQPENLTNFFIEKGEIETPENTSGISAYFSELDENKDDVLETNVENSEMPRFVRGFHDVLITIGIVVVLSALASLSNLIFVLVAVWILAEYFVKKQNLALPAFVLSIAFICCASYISSHYYNELVGLPNTEKEIIVAAASIAIMISALICVFYWRFRIPVSLAVLIASVPTIVLFLILYSALLVFGEDNARDMLSRIAYVLAPVCAAMVFAFAMKLDFSDRLRKTKRSDVAFWLNLIAAPLLLYSLLSIVFLDEQSLSFNNFGVAQAVGVLLVISTMMLIGVVIDRRAFVTAGLMSLGGAIFVLVKNMDVGYTSFFSISALIVGIIVLTIGVGWEFLRRQIVPKLPNFIVERVPPVERHIQ